MDHVKNEFSKDSSIVKQVSQQFQQLNLRQARNVIYLDNILVALQCVAYSRNIDSNDFRAEVLGLQAGDLGDGSTIVNKLLPPVLICLLFCMISHVLKTRTRALIQFAIILSMVRAHGELLFIDAISPLDPSKGYNRMKLWVGCLLWAI